MSEELIQMVTHGATGLAGAGGVGAFMKWWQSREAQNLATQVALMNQKIDQLMAQAAKHDALGERMARNEDAVKAAHNRIDDMQQTRRRTK